MAMSDIRARLEQVITGNYGNEFLIPLDHFRLKPVDRTLESADPGTLERSVDLRIAAERTPLIPVDRTSGVGYYSYPVVVRVAYVLTGAGDPGESDGPQSGEATLPAVEDRADTDRNRLESALGSWLNTGALNPHVIDLRPVGGGGLELLADRAILTVPFEMILRAPL